MRATLKLSTAMILGGTLARHVPYASDTEDAGCAIQLAGLAGCNEGMHWIHQQRATCPGCSHGIAVTVGGAIVCLNDNHKWNLDRIAEWVASVEPVEAEPARTEEPCTSNLTPLFVHSATATAT